MKKLILFLFVILLSFEVNAQNIIKGKITDINNEPLIGATIYLPELNKGTISNNSGEYELSNIPNGIFKMRISFIGYYNEIKTVEINKQENIVNAQLNKAIIQSQEVVVTSGYYNSQHENAVKIDVLENQDFDLAATPNFMESLTQISGVNMISNGSGISKPVIRGLSMNNVLSLNNGVRIENYQFSDHHPLGIDENDIEGVEVIKGPASLLYGSDAIGGVLNFIREKPAPVNKINGYYRLQLHSNTLGMNNSLGIKGSTESFYGGLNFGNKTHKDYLQGGGDFVPNSRFNELTFKANAGYTSKIGTFNLYFDKFSQKLGSVIPKAIEKINESGRENEMYYHTFDNSLISSKNKLYFGNYKFDLNLAYQDVLINVFEEDPVPKVEQNMNTITYDSKLQLSSDPNSLYILGIQGIIREHRNLNNRERQFLPNADVNNIGFLGLIQYTFFDNLKLQGGLRYDIYNFETYALGNPDSNNYRSPLKKEYSNFNGSIGATYVFSEDYIIRANFAKGYRIPNVFELKSFGQHEDRFEKGNENLTPQNSYETDLSLHYHGDYLSFDVATFYNQIQDYIYISPTNEKTGDGLEIFEYRQSDANLFGGEATVHYHPESIPWLHLLVNYSSVIGKQTNGDYLPLIPPHKFNYELSMKAEQIGFLNNPSIKISALTALKQNNTSPEEEPTDGYTIINLSVYSEISIFNQSVVLELTAKNLFDTKYIDHLSLLKELREEGYTYYYPGRNISLYLKIPFDII